MIKEAIENETTKSKEESGALILDQILETTNIKHTDQGYNIARLGVETFINNMINKEEHQGKKASKNLVDVMIADIDEKLSIQIDEILHNEVFQKLESTWRGLKFLIDKTNFRENIEIEILNVTKAELAEDFEDASEIIESALYKHVYTEEYGQFGGKPYGLIIGNYDFEPNNQDIMTLKSIAQISAMAHAPFVAAAAPSMFGVESYTQIPTIKDLKSVYEMPQFIKWNSFRESEDSRNIGLTAPRFLLRIPYGEYNTIKSFNYTERVGSDNKNYVWGNTAFAFASNITSSFAKYRWCSNIIGPKGGGTVDDLPIYNFKSMGGLESKIPTEILISERKELEISEAGFIALTMRKGKNNAAFFSANSTQLPKVFPNTTEGQIAELNYKLGTQLPYMFVINRLAHYIKVIQRENIGTWKGKIDLEKELNSWLRQYVADQDNPSQSVRSRRPLKNALIEVEDVPGEAGWYKVGVKVTPHFKYMGVTFTLSLVGKLEKE